MRKYLASVAFIMTLIASSSLRADKTSLHSITCQNKANCPEGLAKLVVTVGKDEWKCTGFLISKKILATNRHCLPEKNLSKQSVECHDTIRIHFAETKNHKSESNTCKKVLSFSDGQDAHNVANLDFAFLELETNSDRKPFPISHEGIKENEKLVFWRVDGLTQSTVRKDMCKAIYHSLLFPFTENPSSPVITLESCAAEHGNSGSPILNKDGKVVAILEGMNNQKNVDFFKEKFKASQLENIIKASNLACIKIPNESGLSISETCKQKKSENEFLIEGNEILKKAAENKINSNTDLRFGIRFSEGVLYHPEYSPLVLRQNHLFIGKIPRCIDRRADLVSKSKEMDKIPNQKYTHLLPLGSTQVCEVKFSFNSVMKVTNVTKSACRNLDGNLLFMPTDKESTIPFYFVALDNAGNVAASIEGTLSSCK